MSFLVTCARAGGGGNKTGTNLVECLYSFRALFVLYRVELNNKGVIITQRGLKQQFRYFPEHLH